MMNRLKCIQVVFHCFIDYYKTFEVMRVYIVAGVSGAGKTTIGKRLAAELGLPFEDADDYHSPQNIAKMRKGKPLQDEDRKEWLHDLSQKIQEWHKKEGAVLACSALKKGYREILSHSIPKQDLIWIFLHSEYDVISRRLEERKEHFFEPSLLQSQYDELEIADFGIHIDVDTSEKNIIKEIMEKLNEEGKGSEIGLIGLGVMGKSLALNMASQGFDVSVYNRNVPGVEEDIARNFAHEHRNIHSFPWFHELGDFLDSLERPRNIMLMVSAGKAVDSVLENLLPLLQPGDLILDGGNSHYEDTRRRQELLKQQNVFFIGVGISGGEEGALKGPSIMPGGAREAFSRVQYILEKISARDKNGNPCCAYLGSGGSGHFVKMVHNGIEYGEMQLIAETYQFLRFCYQLEPNEIAGIFEDWNRQIRSFLLEISIDILRKKEEGDFLIDKVLDAAKQKGTGGWSTIAALDLGVPLDTITAAVMARNISGRKEERAKAKKDYSIDGQKRSRKKDFSSLFEAYHTAMLINHAVGFDLLSKASEEYKWNLDLSEVARIWTNGCIIRSAFMERLVDLLEREELKHLLLHPDMITEVKSGSEVLSSILSEALESGVPVPLMSAAMNYFLSFTSNPSSANFIQAQRDYFGAHTYERTDKPRGEFFHSNWKGE